MPISGSSGKVKIDGIEVAHITRWSFTQEAALDNFATSSTGGEEDNVAGTISRNGTFDFKVDEDQMQYAQLAVGAAVALELILNSGKKFSGPARIATLECETVIDGGPAITGSASFRGRPGWTLPN